MELPPPPLTTRLATRQGGTTHSLVLDMASNRRVTSTSSAPQLGHADRTTQDENQLDAQSLQSDTHPRNIARPQYSDYFHLTSSDIIRLRQSGKLPRLCNASHLLVSQGVIACNKGNPLLCYFSISRSLRKWRSCRCYRRPFRLVLIRLFTSLLILATFFFVLYFCNKYILNFSVFYSC
jgi:hypothetical protein